MRSENIFRSFRFELVLSSLLAMLYTLLTEAALSAVAWMIYRILTGSKRGIVSGTDIPVEMSGKGSGAMGAEDLINYGMNSALNSPMTGNKTIGNMAGGTQSIAPKDVDSGLLLAGFVILIALGILLFIVYFLLLTRRFSLYLTEIGEGIGRISEGNLESRIEIRSDDELGRIAENLNRMTDELKERMEAERSAENTKNELITSVAHDLRTPLTSILGYLDLAASGKVDEETRQKYISISYSKSKRLEKLIEDLFSFTKLTAEEHGMNIQSFDLVKMMEQLVDEFYPGFQENQLTCEFCTEASQIMMEADADQLARAFANLIGNAVKYGAAGKNIRIEIQQKAGKIITAVTNYGELIPEKDIPNIFNRFYRVESSRSSETGGSGLGLAIAKSIVEKHGGTIRVKSDFDGTVFTVILPVSAKDRSEETE